MFQVLVLRPSEVPVDAERGSLGGAIRQAVLALVHAAARVEDAAGLTPSKAIEPARAVLDEIRAG
jgi:hypothetical protein